MQQSRLGFLLGISLLLNAVTLTVASVNSFWDVPTDQWYSPAISRLEDKNILQGSSDGSYNLEEYVNRAELAVIIDRTLEYIETGTVEVLPTALELSVPFTAQAPAGDWSMPYQEACEEASLVMTQFFLSGETLNTATADTEILKVLAWEEENNYGIDVGAEDMLAIASGVYGLDGQVYYDEDVTVESIKRFLSEGHPVIIPAAGQVLNNPNYRGDGPPYHMIVLIGFNETGFITNDPGTRYGASYEYSYATIESAIHDWTGSKSTVEADGRKAIIVLSAQ